MFEDFSIAVEKLVSKAPLAWLTSACEALKVLPPTATAEFVLQRLPATNNADLSFLMSAVVRCASNKMSWEALAWALSTAFSSYHRWQAAQHIELLWSGPAPTDRIAARRIDQTLYDLIANAKREILLVTFAALKIDRLTDGLWKAAQRGVRIQLILEFEASSEGQLSYDAIKAFPQALLAAADVYYWPVEKRDRNQAGRPGKLHAKIALVDSLALVSSANLTDDAFNRNLEVGILVANPAFLASIRTHVESLISERTLCLIRNSVQN